jgi:small GTP-binding protein
MKNTEEQEIKVILVGESGAGKTSLINVAIGLHFEEGREHSTSSSTFVTKEVEINKKIYKLNLWDTIGQEKFRALTNIFIKDSKIVILVYDITRAETFNELEYWYNTIREILGDEPVLGIAGNKQDLFVKEEVSEETAEKYAKEKNIPLKLTSAKSPSSFISFLDDLVKQYIEKKGAQIEERETQKLEAKDGFIKYKKKFC